MPFWGTTRFWMKQEDPCTSLGAMPLSLEKRQIKLEPMSCAGRLSPTSLMTTSFWIQNNRRGPPPFSSHALERL